MKKVAPIVLNPSQKDNHLEKTDVAKSCLLIPLGHLSQPKISHSKISLGSFKLYGKFIAHIWLMENREFIKNHIKFVIHMEFVNFFCYLYLIVLASHKIE